MTVDFKDYARRMDKALEHLAEEFGAVRAGRANAKVAMRKIRRDGMDYVKKLKKASEIT